MRAGVSSALFNIASMTGNHLTEFDRQFDQWRKAFYALQPAILEETWARLFLLTHFYALLRPTSYHKPQRALTAALIITIFIHGLAHYPQSLSNPVFAIFIALMYGIPLGLIYIKRDYESTIAYHFFVDFGRFAYTVNLIN
jgi:membrane protease YdiL (CAAX protease family)